jgi:hypothetical protein
VKKKKKKKKLALLSESERNREKIMCTVYSLTLLTLRALLCSAIYTPLSLWPLYVNVDDDWLELRTVKNMRMCAYVVNSGLDLTYVSAVGLRRWQTIVNGGDLFWIFNCMVRPIILFSLLMTWQNG